MKLAQQMGDSIWPGFRPDTIPVMYALRGQGRLLVGWPGKLPAGFTPVVTEPSGAPQGIGWQSSSDLGAASTGTELEGRPTAQVVVSDSDGVASLVGLTTHESFHVFERAVRKEGTRFGQGENAFLVTSYPVFDPQNEAGWALEGRILAAAVGPRGATGAQSTKALRGSQRTLALQFLAVRESRQRALGAEFAEFEELAELNEGLAEYTLVRSVQLAARSPDFPDRVGAQRLQGRKLEALQNLTGNANLSIRLRFYATGPALGALLDALEGPAWKTRLVADNLMLQDALADASGYRSTERSLRRQAESTFVMKRLRAAADSAVTDLRAARRAQIDSILAKPGVQLLVTVEGGYLGSCGIDPQNLLQAAPGVLLHTRWLQACAGDALQATFNTPVVQDQQAQSLSAVVGADSAVQLTIGGQKVPLANAGHMDATDVRLESPVVALKASKADVAVEGRVLKIKIKR